MRNRANGACEYCRIAEKAVLPALTSFQVEHIVPRAHFSPGSVAIDDLGNLAWSCQRCNLLKHAAVQGYDDETGQYSRLFHPRTDVWREHFVGLPSGRIDGLTLVGRVTVKVLKLNDGEDVVTTRAEYQLLGWWPILP